MGRLFWKFFFFFLLAQMTTIAGVSAAIWLEHLNRSGPPIEHVAPPDGTRFEGPKGPPHSGIQRSTPRGRGIPIEPIIGGLAASLVFGALLAWYVSTPIRSLRSAFDAAARGNFDVRVSPKMGKRRDELADLGREFDRTSVQLKALMDGQRRLLHEVSHELRSPLARLQMAVGLARQQPEQLDTWMDRIERESTRMDKLVDELLTLSRVESGVLGEHAEPVPIAELVHEVVKDAKFEADAGGRNVEWNVDLEALDSAVVTGRAEFLHRAIENIVRNAVKHTPEGGHVKVAGQMESGGRALRLWVMDEGPGVPEPEMASIFQPFFRAATAEGTEGHGVGLAIARSVVGAHGGSIRAANREQGGLSIEVVLPIR